MLSLRKKFEFPSNEKLNGKLDNKNSTSSSYSPGSSTQLMLWGEEEEKDSIRTIYLKKVRYRSEAIVLSDEEQSSILWETVKVVILKAATLPRLVENLAPSSLQVVESDPGFLVAFLCTYKTFATVEEVLDLLLARFENQKKPICLTEKTKEGRIYIKSRICSAISIWLEQYPSDFDDAPHYKCMHKIIKFFKKQEQTTGVKDALEKAESKYRTLVVSPFETDAPLKFKLCSCPQNFGCECDFSKLVDGLDHCGLHSFEATEIAEQLTLIDSELFKRVIPRQSLGSFWSKRGKTKGESSATIKATVDQFNMIAMCVTTTVLLAMDAKSSDPGPTARAKAIKKWIDVAQDCRTLKNFSSVKAILAGLQSAAVHRLRRSWEHLTRETQLTFDDLSDMFSEELNQKASRELLMQEGTAKYASIDNRRVNKKCVKRRQSWMKEGVMQGTVPYMGTFLTDLMMLDAAYPDRLENGFINFEKKRKEFEIIIQLILLQEAAKNYSLQPNHRFIAWLNSVKLYTEKESYATSLELEPDRDKPRTPQPQRKEVTLRRNLSEPDIGHMLSEKGLTKNIRSSAHARLSPKASSPSIGTYKVVGDAPSTPSSPLSTGSPSPSAKEHFFAGIYKSTHWSGKYKMATLPVMNERRESISEDQLIQVAFEDKKSTSILLSNNDTSLDVISNALAKFDQKGHAEEFNLHQLLEKSKELHIPAHTNVIFAMNKTQIKKFRVTRRKLLKTSC